MKTGRYGDIPLGVRLPAVTGLFYPDDPTILTRELDSMLARAKVKSPDGAVVALILPHAGYRYSGFTAAVGYKLLEEKTFDTIVIVSPSHREYFKGISIFDGTSYLTPLGEMKIDEPLRAALTTNDPCIRSGSVGHGEEHAIEVHLPFIQRLIRNATILPIVMGDQRREYCFHLGRRVAEVLRGKRALLIASTDLSHYHTYDAANSLDTILIDAIARFDYEQIMTDLEEDRVEACGGGPIVAVLAAARELGATKVEILYHCNSGDVTGDRSTVVGYLSAAVLRAN